MRTTLERDAARAWPRATQRNSTRSTFSLALKGCQEPAVNAGHAAAVNHAGVEARGVRLALSSFPLHRHDRPQTWERVRGPRRAQSDVAEAKPWPLASHPRSCRQVDPSVPQASYARGPLMSRPTVQTQDRDTDPGRQQVVWTSRSRMAGRDAAARKDLAAEFSAGNDRDSTPHRPVALGSLPAVAGGFHRATLASTAFSDAAPSAKYTPTAAAIGSRLAFVLPRFLYEFALKPGPRPEPRPATSAFARADRQAPL